MQMPLLITGMYKKTTPLKVSGAFVWAQMKRLLKHGYFKRARFAGLIYAHEIHTCRNLWYSNAVLFVCSNGFVN